MKDRSKKTVTIQEWVVVIALSSFILSVICIKELKKFHAFRSVIRAENKSGKQ